MMPYLACHELMPRISAPEELLHPSVPPDLFVTCARDVLEKTYRIELQAVLRLEAAGAPPSSTTHDISSRPTQRNYYDDWDFLVHEKKPSPLAEWLRCLRWLCNGRHDGSTTVDCLTRTEGTGDEGGTHDEVLLERAFSAGSLRCVLARVDEGEWKIAGLQVRVSDEFLPPGPLLTWHDTEPFDDTFADPALAIEEAGEEGADEN